MSTDSLRTSASSFTTRVLPSRRLFRFQLKRHHRSGSIHIRRAYCRPSRAAPHTAGSGGGLDRHGRRDPRGCAVRGRGGDGAVRPQMHQQLALLYGRTLRPSALYRSQCRADPQPLPVCSAPIALKPRNPKTLKPKTRPVLREVRKAHDRTRRREGITARQS
eukprot:738309-Prorocentrum_minimum.AAC.1